MIFTNKRWEVGGRYGYSAIDCQMPNNKGIHHTVCAGLTRKVADLITNEHNSEIEYARQEIAELKDKLRRRNMQIKDLKIYKTAWDNWFSIIDAGATTVNECIEIAHKVLPDEYNR